MSSTMICSNLHNKYLRVGNVSCGVSNWQDAAFFLGVATGVELDGKWAVKACSLLHPLADEKLLLLRALECLAIGKDHGLIRLGQPRNDQCHLQAALGTSASGQPSDGRL